VVERHLRIGRIRRPPRWRDGRLTTAAPSSRWGLSPGGRRVPALGLRLPLSHQGASQIGRRKNKRAESGQVRVVLDVVAVGVRVRGDPNRLVRDLPNGAHDQVEEHAETGIGEEYPIVARLDDHVISDGNDVDIVREAADDDALLEYLGQT